MSVAVCAWHKLIKFRSSFHALHTAGSATLAPTSRTRPAQQPLAAMYAQQPENLYITACAECQRSTDTDKEPSGTPHPLPAPDA